METQYISLNMTPTGVNPCFHISQYDIGRPLGVKVHNGAEVVDLDSYTCTIEATRSDGVAITASVATNDNVGTFETTATMTNKADKYKAQFVIVDENSKRIASLPFDMDVVKAAMDENSEAIEEDASLYQQYTEAVQGAIAEANADIQAEENARIAAVNAEATARQNADATLQNNIDAEATARQSADNTLQGNINSEASTRASADSNLQSQINQIIAPSGEAPSAAEVQNARIGADGVTYDTLGNAIRGQVGDLKNDFANFHGKNLIGLEAGKYYKVFIPRGIHWTMSTSDGQVLGTGVLVDVYYNEGRTSSDYWTLGGTQSDRTISDTAGDIYWLKLRTQPRCPIQIEIGEKTTYTEHFASLYDVNESMREHVAYGEDINPITIDGIFYNNGGRAEGTNFKTDFFYVKGYSFIKTKFKKSQYVDFLIFLDESEKVISSTRASATESTYTETMTSVPSDAYYVAFSNLKTQTDASYVQNMSYNAKSVFVTGKNPWENKRIVWFGTSIPAGGNFGYNSPISYPELIGQKLGAYVVNESVGSSSVHCKTEANISAENPYGFHNNFENVSRCLTNNLTEMQWVIDNYDSDIFQVGRVDSMPTELQANIRRCSYEKKLDRYLTDDSFPDLFVFDHGRNDRFDPELEDHYMTELTGTEKQGGYSHHSYVSNTGNKSIEFDLSGIDAVILDMVSGQYWDYYNLFDSNGDVITASSSTMATKNGENYHKFIDTSNAEKIIVSTNDLSSVSVKDYSSFTNLYTFNGAMNFLFERIKEFNPKARILMVGHYENQLTPYVATYQKVVANRWSIPIMPLWDILGWSQNVVFTKGNWIDGIWVPNAIPSGHYMTELEIALPDNLHPHTDASHKTLEILANHISRWLEQYSEIF